MAVSKLEPRVKELEDWVFASSLTLKALEENINNLFLLINNLATKLTALEILVHQQIKPVEPVYYESTPEPEHTTWRNWFNT